MSKSMSIEQDHEQVEEGKAIDLNSDLGEDESAAKTARLMQHLTSANIACGGHAGGANSMSRCVKLALRHKVRIGAHPGPASRTDFGRGQLRIEAAELELIMLQHEFRLRISGEASQT